MRSASSTPSLVPDFDITVHIVLDDFGKLGRSYRETDEATRETQSEKATRLIGEIGFVVAFCLAGLTLAVYIAIHLPVPSQFLG
jgi:hypothetical protein